MPLFILRDGRTMEMLVPKLHDMESAAVDIEMYVALLEIRGDGLPNLDFRMHPLDRLPCSLADALAMGVGIHKKQFQLSFSDFLVNAQDKAADFLPVTDDAICLGFLTINGVDNGLT